MNMTQAVQHIRDGTIQKGTAFTLDGPDIYEITQEIEIGIYFATHLDKTNNYLPLMIKSNRQAFERDNISKLGLKLLYLGIGKYKDIMGRNRQILMFQNLTKKR
jgi:hypothetical protein